MMADTFDPNFRSWIMSRVLSRGTKPERVVCEALRKAGIRFTVQPKDIPGNPDFIIRRIRLAIFVNGCFWHWHGCIRCRLPGSNTEYWEQKIGSNVSRDRRTRRALTRAGWRYWTIWECAIPHGVSRLVGRISALESQTAKL